MEGKAALFSVTDPSFCPQCGSILPLPGVSDVVCCKLCSFQQNTESWLSKINSRDPISAACIFIFVQCTKAWKSIPVNILQRGKNGRS